MARIFLYVCALVIAAVIATAVAWRLYPGWFMRAAFEPTEAFQPVAAPAPNIYADKGMWIARPDMAGDNPTLWLPRLHNGETRAGGDRFPLEQRRGDAAIFFVHPTSHLTRSGWNASLDDAEANWRATLFTRGMASSLAGAGDVWAPRYRQAALGAFLTDDVDTANRALSAAFNDVDAAFEQFLEEIPPDRPIILAGHSQGSLHVMRLLAYRIARRPVARRIAAVYLVGWPVSMTADLPALGLPACANAESSGCILSWQSFGEPADPAMIVNVYDQTIGLNNLPRAGTRMLCVNPISGLLDGGAEAGASLGTVKADSNLDDGELFLPGVAARCDDAAAGGRGFLSIGEGPDLGGFLLPGNNYHVYDYPLFWANIRADARHRSELFEAR